MKQYCEQSHTLSAYAADLIERNPPTESALSQAKKDLAKQYKLAVPSGPTLIEAMKNLQPTVTLLRLLRKRSVRTMSGIAPVAVLTKPYSCPGRCAYCPKETAVPRSYLSNEPAVMRAIYCRYQPYKQVAYRLRALEANGHEPTKIELIIIGGTWSYLPNRYQYWFIKECFRAANDFGKRQKRQTTDNKQHAVKQPLSVVKKLLAEEQTKNERAKYQIIGLTLETRPDFINARELKEMRELGATRVELGVQILHDEVLKINHRDSTVADIVRATRALKDWGFKVTYHVMPALPGSTPDKDLASFRQMFTPIKDIKYDVAKKLLTEQIDNNDFNPDQIKFYPTVVVKGSLLYRWWRADRYQPYSDEVLQKLIVDCKALVPPFVRIIRLIRDIPGESIIAGNKITNLRQIMQARGLVCRCIRCREAKTKPTAKPTLFIAKYRASQANEYFISYESDEQKNLYGFLRLRLNENNGPFGETTAVIRELHVYGELVPIAGPTKIQHTGLGKALVKQAESIAKQADYNQIAIIAGIGVRPYYRRLGYKLTDSYMIKRLKKHAEHK